MSDPAFIKPGDLRGTENTGEEAKAPWNGPDAATMIALALKMPGAKQRQHGVKFQCAGCAAEGHDKSMDNACLFLDGRFSCAHTPGPAHRAMIAESLNIPIVVAPQAKLSEGNFAPPDPLDAPLQEQPPL